MSDSESFEQMLDAQLNGLKSDFKLGEKVNGTIISVTDKVCLLDINAKSEGIVERGELEASLERTPEVGEEVELYYAGSENGEIILECQMKSDDLDNADLKQAYADKVPVEGKVKKDINGGFEISLGDTRAFCPVSQIDTRHVEDKSVYVGQNLSFLISEINGSDVVVSRRQLLESKLGEQKEKLKEELHEGDIVTGTVARLMEFGAFVNLGGVDGLIPISELSWDHVKEASDIVKEGESVDVKVLKIDWDKDRITLSKKQAEGDPWEGVIHKYVEATAYKGTVTKLMDFGAFVQLEPGVEGLVHISKLGAGKRLNHASEVLEEKQELEVYIDNIDLEKKRISLLLENEQTGRTMEVAGVELVVGSEVQGIVDQVKPYGVFVKLNPQQNGLLHISQIPFEGQVNRVRDMHDRFQEGTKVQVIIKEIHEGKVSLTLPETEQEEDFREYMDDKKDDNNFGNLGGIFDNLDIG